MRNGQSPTLYQIKIGLSHLFDYLYYINLDNQHHFISFPFLISVSTLIIEVDILSSCPFGGKASVSEAEGVQVHEDVLPLQRRHHPGQRECRHANVVVTRRPLRRTAGAMTQSIEREDATGGVGGPCVGDGRCSQTKRKSFWRPAIPCLRAGAAPASPTFAHH